MYTVAKEVQSSFGRLILTCRACRSSEFPPTAALWEALLPHAGEKYVDAVCLAAHADAGHPRSGAGLICPVFWIPATMLLTGARRMSNHITTRTGSEPGTLLIQIGMLRRFRYSAGCCRGLPVLAICRGFQDERRLRRTLCQRCMR